MWVFKDKAIVLNIKKIKDKELLYTLFTYEYWKIRANKKYSKTEKSLDLGYIINFEIVTKENVSIHKIKNIKIKSSFNSNKDKNFYELNNYMILLSKIFKEIPDWVQNKEIFNIIDFVNNFEKIDEIKLILTKIKIESILWNLWDFHKNKLVEKIVNFIIKNEIKTIFKLTWINEETKKELEKI